jgi:hypothetical protein
MKIVLSEHAKERIKERNISLSEVREVIENPEIKAPTRHRRRKRAMRKIGHRTLDIIYEEKSDYIFVITCAALSKGDGEK